MTKQYELVCVIDAGVTSKDVDALKSKIEKPLTILATDDMGLLPLAYPLRGHSQAYFVSYHIDIDADTMKEVTTMLKLEKGVAKFVFYAMKDRDTFMMYSDLKKSYDALVEEEEAAKMDDQPKTEELEDTEEQEETQE